MAEIRKGQKPADYLPSVYGNKCEKHAWELEDCCSVKVSELFPQITPAIYNEGDDLSIIAEHTRKSLENVDMSMIKPYDRINLCCSEHGFGILGGRPYLEMIKTIKQVVEERTNNQRIKVVLAMYRTPSEVNEVIENLDLHKELDCEIVGVGPFDDGIKIETSIGPVLGIKKVYDCEWMIYAYYDDPREIYVHRGINRLFKSFMMNFARYETRSSVHHSFGQTSANIISTAVYESEFVQNKFAFSTILMTSPTGVCAIESDRDLFAINKKSQANMLKNYSIIRELFASLDDWYAIWDGERWGYYLHTAGIVFGVCSEADDDFFDLDIPWCNGIGRGYANYKGGNLNTFMGIMPTFKGGVMNQSWIGLSISWIARFTTFYCVGKEQLEMYRRDKTNPMMAELVHPVDTLEEGVAKCDVSSDTKNYVVFDGSFDNINCSRSAAEDILKKAPIALEKAMSNYPRYLRQRGFTEEEIAELTK